MDKDIWTYEDVRTAIIQGNPHLEIILSKYLKSLGPRICQCEIAIENVTTIDELNQKVLAGIEQLEVFRKELLSVVDLFAPSRHPLLSVYLPRFFADLLNQYEQQGINLYTDNTVESLRNDHFRFFNQLLMVSLASLLVENKCFDALYRVVHNKYVVQYRSYNGMSNGVSFIRFRSYNYTLNENLNTTTPRRISVTADKALLLTGKGEFMKIVRADILLYYLSLWNHTGDIIDRYWNPEYSVYNRYSEILPQLVSRGYFEESKVLFGVSSIDEFRHKLDATEDILERNGLYRVPSIKVGLMYDKVGSQE